MSALATWRARRDPSQAPFGTGESSARGPLVAAHSATVSRPRRRRNSAGDAEFDWGLSRG